MLKTPGYASHDSRVVTSLQSRDIDLFNPESDQHVISPHNNTAELFMKIMRIREMVTNLKKDSPCQHQRKCIEECGEFGY